jgi:hypothetical protein
MLEGDCMTYYKKDGYYYELNDGIVPVWKGNEASNSEKFAEVEAYLAEHPEALIDEPKPPEPTAEQIAQRERTRITAALDAIDRKAIRPLRAIAAGSTSALDAELIGQLDAEAKALRTELAAL